MDDPSTIAKRWLERIGQSAAKFKAGVQAVSESPTAKAAMKADKYVQGVQRAVSDGRYQRGLNAVSTESWKQSMLSKGLERLEPGARASLAKTTAFWAEFGPFLASVQAQVNSMPDDTLEQRIAKSTELQRKLATFRRNG